MKKGYSDIFGITVDASEVVHKDCEAFQIVCPECREYVFKGLRQQGETAIHYFSHFRNDPDLNRQCELRAATREAQGQPSAGGTQEQTLQSYLSCFTSMLESMPYIQDPEAFAKHRRIMDASKSYRNLRRLIREGFIADDAPSNVRQIAYGDADDGGIYARWDSRKTGWTPATEFSRSIQARVASDMMRTLLTRPAMQAWNDLFAAAWVLTDLHCRNNAAKGKWADYTRMLGPILAMGAAGRDFSREFARVGVLPCSLPYLRHGGTWGFKLAVEIVDQIYEILLGIDYSRWSRARLEGHEPQTISSDMRARVAEEYDRQVAQIRAAGVEPEEQDWEKRRGMEAQRIASIPEVGTQIQAVVHRAMTGEGIEFRHDVEHPDPATEVDLQMILARPPHGTVARIRKTTDAIRRTWPSCGDLRTSNTGVVNGSLKQRSTFGTLVGDMALVAREAGPGEVTVVFVAGTFFMSAVHDGARLIVERIGGVKPD